MRNHILWTSLFVVLAYVSNAGALDLVFTGRTPDFPKTSKVEVTSGVMPGIPVLFDLSQKNRVILRPARSDEQTTKTRPVYRFEWQQDKSTMFYELYDPKLLDELSKSNAKDVAAPKGQDYEKKVIESFFENGKLLQTCVTSSFAGDITAYVVINKDGDSEQVVILPEGSVAQCILKASHGKKLPSPSSRFVAKASIHIKDSDTNKSEKKASAEPQCYLPYAASRDHMVTGCEVPGYHMRYDLAKVSGAFMILLPDGANSINNTPNYFSIQTLSLDGGTLQDLFNADVKNTLEDKPGTKVVKRLTYQLPGSSGGSCFGAVMEYHSKLAEFTNETFYICDTGSKKYAILLALGARTKKAMEAANPAFIKWMNVPQIVRDMKIEIEK